MRTGAWSPASATGGGDAQRGGLLGEHHAAGTGEPSGLLQRRCRARRQHREADVSAEAPPRGELRGLRPRGHHRAEEGKPDPEGEVDPSAGLPACVLEVRGPSTFEDRLPVEPDRLPEGERLGEGGGSVNFGRLCRPCLSLARPSRRTVKATLRVVVSEGDDPGSCPRSTAVHPGSRSPHVSLQRVRPHTDFQAVRPSG